jgi:hypothetical protein
LILLKNLYLHTFATCLLEQASDLTGGAQRSFIDLCISNAMTDVVGNT